MPAWAVRWVEIEAEHIDAARRWALGQARIGLGDGLKRGRAEPGSVGFVDGDVEYGLLDERERFLAGVGAGWAGGSRR